MSSDQPEHEFARLRWHCRRGMKELDVVLEGYLALHYADAPAEDRKAFEALLELPDPELLYQLTGRTPSADETQARVIEILRRTAHP
ncbi:MAG: succinate dehydrogenase assembly factor 2 [Gammaproteobacteria bacterium]